MSDIAMLVAEEYERRVKKKKKKNSRKTEDPDGERIQLFSHFSHVPIKEILPLPDGFSFDLMKNMVAVADEKLKYFEPINEVTEAARNCAFSA